MQWNKVKKNHWNFGVYMAKRNVETSPPQTDSIFAKKEKEG